MATEQNVRVDEVAVEMRNIVKKFGDFTANDGINLVVHRARFTRFSAKTARESRH